MKILKPKVARIEYLESISGETARLEVEIKPFPVGVAEPHGFLTEPPQGFCEWLPDVLDNFVKDFEVTTGRNLQGEISGTILVTPCPYQLHLKIVARDHFIKRNELVNEVLEALAKALDNKNLKSTSGYFSDTRPPDKSINWNTLVEKK